METTTEPTEENWFDRQLRIAADAIAARPSWMQPDWYRERQRQEQATQQDGAEANQAKQTAPSKAPAPRQ